jgi:hypothetical protein
MSENGKRLEHVIEIRVRRMNALAIGISVGLVLGLGLFAATNLLILKGGEHVGFHLKLLNEYLPGYRVTFLGSLLGFAYLFVIGLAATYLGASVYNKVAGYREGRQPPR